MMKKTGFILSILLVAITLTSCSSVNINDEKAVVEDLQGTWTGYDRVGEMYMHVKLFIKEDHFDGWIQTTDSEQVPQWEAMPQEQGMFSLSAVLDNSGKNCRRLKFSVVGRCCGDKSTAIQTLSRNIAYTEGQGLQFGTAALLKN